MTRNLDHLFGLQDLRSCPVIALQLVMAVRLSILYSHAGRDSLPDLAVRLRSMRAAQSVEQLVLTINRIWPEQFAIHRPCSIAMSPDEALLAEIATAATRGEQSRASDAMRDLLPCLSRDRMFRETVEIVDALEAVRAQAAHGPD